jgi:hypothetical protein
VLWLVVAAVVAAIIIVVGWANASAAHMMKNSMVNGADIAEGSVVYKEKYVAHYTLLTWNNHYHRTSATGKENDEVVNVLILDNLNNDHDRAPYGHSSTETDYAVNAGYVFQNKNDVLYQYKAITWRNNRAVDFSIQDALYDFNKGTLFLIRVEENGDVVQVQQFYADLSNIVADLSDHVEPDNSDGYYNDVQEFCETNEHVLAFLKELE